MSKIPVVAAPEGRSSILLTTNLDTPDFRWVGLKKLIWQDPMGKSREWECAFRTTRRSECDGVAVVAFVRYPVSGKEDEVVLVSQYRPPVGAEVMEAPAGLVDAGEDAKTAAERELLEETGFSGRVTCVSPIVPCDPGMTDANMRFVTIEVNGDAEENQNPKARLEDGEFITLRRLPARSMQEGLDAFAAAGFQVDARLYAMAVGYTLGRRDASGNSSSTVNSSSSSSNAVKRGGGSGGSGSVGKGFRKTWALWALCLLSPVVVVVASVAGRRRMGCPL